MSVDLPQSWLRVLLNDVGEIVTGKTPSTKNPHNFGGSIPFIKPADLDNGGYVSRTADSLTDLGAKSVPTVPVNSIPVTCIGNLGKVGITNQTSATNQQINTVVPSSQVDYRFFYYQLQTLKPWMQENASATTVTIINKGKFSKAPVTLAPLAEQKVIADKLDTLLAQVENTKARLERIPQILKRFRQSVLAAAVSGRLTEEWRGTPAISSQQPPLTIGREEEEAPLGWEWRNLIDLAKLESGHTPRKSRPDYWENGDVPWISLQDIRKAHGKVINETKFMPNLKGIENSSARLLPAGTVCFSRDISVGFTTIMGREMATTQHFVNWICGANLNNHYLMYAFMAAKDHLTISGQGTTVKTIYMPACKQFRIITPPLEEQTEIVRRVDQLFAHADRIEQQVNNALARVNSLTHSILAKAFRGELTEQWRKENPALISGENSAEALLERIKADRAAAEKPKRRKTKA